jgi:hypothetical protein
MRGTLVVAVVLLTSFVLTAPAGAAAPTPAEKKLQGQVAALQKQVKTLTQATNFAIGLNICSTALTADAFQATWTAINTHEAVTLFPAESQVNDLGACTDAKVTRAPTANPPNLTPFKALLSIFSSFG